MRPVSQLSIVEVNCLIEAPPQRVWDVVMNPLLLERWVTIHRRLVECDPPPPRCGYRMRQLLSLRGVRLEVSWELIDCNPPYLAVWEGRGPARSHAHTEYRLAEVNGQTRFLYLNRFQPPLGILGTVASRALVGGIPEREATRSIALLKELVEDRRDNR